MGEKTWDLLIAGGGMAGLSAALAAAQKGIGPLVLEKGATHGGAANLSAGMFWAPKTIERLRDYVPEGNPKLQKMLCERFPATLSWLENSGIPLAPWDGVAGVGEGRAMGIGRAGDYKPFMDLMANRIRALGGEIRCGTPLLGLKREKDEFHAALGDNSELGAGELIIARAVVLATGGFQANRKLLAKYIGAQAAERLMLRSIEECAGDGLQIALSVGSATCGDFSAFYGHTMPDVKLTPDQLQPLTPYFARYCVMMNREGRRFIDESEGLLEELNPQAACRQPDGLYYIFFDEQIYKSYGINQKVTASVPTVDRLAKWIELGAPVYQAATLPELAAILAREENLPADRILSEMNSYNRACESGDVSRLDPGRVRYQIPIGAGTVYAVRCVPGITCTSGGVAIDEHGRVIGQNGAVIPGLYTAGNDAGGVFGRHYAGYLAWALVTGVVCGETAVHDMKPHAAKNQDQ
jgi:succinate dehydrogenase/fumarate reductase flavoprotein subunit